MAGEMADSPPAAMLGRVKLKAMASPAMAKDLLHRITQFACILCRITYYVYRAITPESERAYANRRLVMCASNPMPLTQVKGF